MKLGERLLNMWINKLQIAIIEKDADSIDALVQEAPKFENTKEIERAMYLLREAMELIYTLKDETALTMKQLKKNIRFIESTQSQTQNRLDVKF
ncbi:hypothetical protein M947_08460 [Sulfurimonas hongkongensis]|uniref:Uncharacterized protein n=2 Tax=Sulfurimonas hongkongensis TaxID=1172190 RepID=T0JQT3_9BACT|nr:hypothetical protein M947_08460 [Sulfurimonas hongkongensis]